MTAKTLGQVGYEAFQATRWPNSPLAWEHPANETQRPAWEAQAQAVIAAHKADENADLKNERDEARAELDQLRERVARVAAALDADALATHPSKKSQIQAEAARRIREAIGA